MTTAGTDPAAPRRPWDRWLPPLLAVVCSANSVFNDFTYDDRGMVRDNARIRSLADWRAIWLTDWWQPQSTADQIAERQRDRLYRPLTMFSLALGHALHGPDAWGHHAVNVLLHAAATAMVGLVALRWLGDRHAASAAALLFAVHPIHVEAVANIVGRAEILAALFLLLGLWTLLPPSRSPGTVRAAVAAPAFLAALLSKETAICYPLLALIALTAAPVRPTQPSAPAHPSLAPPASPGPSRRRVSFWLPHAAALTLPLLVYMPLRLTALEGHLLRDRPPSELANTLIGASWTQRLVTPFTILGTYVRLMLAPSQFCSDYGAGILDAHALPQPLSFLGFAAAAGVVWAITGYGSSAPLRRRCAELAAAVAASYALVSNTVLLIGVTAAERLFYWPSAPLLMLLALLGAEAWRRWFARQRPLVRYGPPLRVTGLVFLAALGLRSAVRNLDWSSNRTLFEADLAAHPRSVNLNIALARELLGNNRRPDAARAVQLLRRGLETRPLNAIALFCLGVAHGQLGERDRAIEYIRHSLELDPVNIDARETLARLELTHADAEARIAALRADLDRAVRAPAPDSERIRLHLELGNLLRRIGRQPLAHAEYQAAVRLAPDDPAVLYAWGESLALNNETQAAIDAFRTVVQRHPDRWEAHANLATMLAATDPAAALNHAEIARRLEPNRYENQVNYAEALAINGRVPDALRVFSRIRDAVPADDPRRAVLDQRIGELERARP